MERVVRSTSIHYPELFLFEGCVYGPSFSHVTPATHVNVGDRVKNVRTSFATACKKVGIDDFHIHDLRHTAASWLVMEGVPLLEVSRLLGHKSITQTERYAHLAPESTRTLVQILEGNAGSRPLYGPRGR